MSSYRSAVAKIPPKCVIKARHCCNLFLGKSEYKERSAVVVVAV